jgi:hypothetical protein
LRNTRVSRFQTKLKLKISFESAGYFSSVCVERSTLHSCEMLTVLVLEWSPLVSKVFSFSHNISGTMSEAATRRLPLSTNSRAAIQLCMTVSMEQSLSREGSNCPSNQDILQLMRNPKLYYRVQSSPPLAVIMSKMLTASKYIS